MRLGSSCKDRCISRCDTVRREAPRVMSTVVRKNTQALACKSPDDSICKFACIEWRRKSPVHAINDDVWKSPDIEGHHWRAARVRFQGRVRKCVDSRWNDHHVRSRIDGMEARVVSDFTQVMVWKRNGAGRQPSLLTEVHNSNIICVRSAFREFDPSSCYRSP